MPYPPADQRPEPFRRGDGPFGPAGGAVPVEDELLLAELRTAFAAVEPPPAALLAAARWAGQLHRGGTDRAYLDVDRPAGAGRVIVFTGPGRSVRLAVRAGAGGYRLSGVVDPSAGGDLAVHHDGGPVRVAVDADGRFTVGAVPAGAVTLTYHPVDGRPLV